MPVSTAPSATPLEIAPSILLDEAHLVPFSSACRLRSCVCNWPPLPQRLRMPTSVWILEGIFFQAIGAFFSSVSGFGSLHVVSVDCQFFCFFIRFVLEPSRSSLVLQSLGLPL
eukprot:m.655955 g.655955  ORF g.655955 m.655955 type:complete len:113 (-) comp58424_c1_seq26:2285-2623(-)